MLIGKKSVVYCLHLSDTKTCDDEKWRHFRTAGALHVHFMGEYTKLNGVKRLVLR